MDVEIEEGKEIYVFEHNEEIVWPHEEEMKLYEEEAHYALFSKVSFLEINNNCIDLAEDAAARWSEKKKSEDEME